MNYRVLRAFALYIALAFSLLLVAVPAALFLTSCKAAVTATDSQGRTFVRVREMKPRGDGTSDAELWQLQGRVGKEHPTYLKLLTPAGTPPLFTQTAP